MQLVCARCQYRSKRITLEDCPKCGFDLEQEITSASQRRLTKTRKDMSARRKEKRPWRQDEAELY